MDHNNIDELNVKASHNDISSIYDLDCHSANELLYIALNKTNQAIELLKNKTDLYGDHKGSWQGVKGPEVKTDLWGDHKGSWQGLNKPTLSEEGAFAQVEKNTEDILNIKNYIDTVNKKNLISVTDFGSINDGITDNTDSFNEAFLFGKNNNCSVLIPPGDYFINGKVNIYNSVICFGNILIPSDNKNAFLNIIRNSELIKLDKNIIGGLNKGSYNLTNINNNKNKTLIITSDIELIKRSNANSVYTKNDCVYITSNDGDIFPRLNCSYNEPCVNVYITDIENNIVLDNINIIVIGENVVDKNFILCNKSNVTFNNLNIINNNVFPLKYGITLNQCSNVNFNNTNIKGCLDINQIDNIALLGYGINIFNSSNININGGNIIDCKHSITGRHANTVNINNINTSQSIDCHWGQDWNITNINNNVMTSVINKVSSHVLFCGENIKITNCNFNGGLSLLGIRSETPELIGNILIDNINVNTNERYFRYVNFTSSDEIFDFGRIITNPNNITIKNCYIKTLNNTLVEYVNLGYNRAYNQSRFNTINIVNCLHPNSYGKYLSGRKNTDFYITGKNTILKVYNTDSNSCNINLTENAEKLGLYSVTLEDTSSDQTKKDNYGFEIDINNSDKVSFKIDNTVVKNMTINNSNVYFSIRRFKDIQTFKMTNSIYRFNNCNIYNITFNILNNLMFFGCVFNGTIDCWNNEHSSNNIDKQLIYSFSNVATVEASGNIPILDNYINKNYFVINNYYNLIKGNDNIIKKLQINNNNVEIFDL